MTLNQIIFLSIGCLFSLIGIFFIYKGIGEQESDLDISFLGKVKTKSTGLILVLVGTFLIFYSTNNNVKGLSNIKHNENDTLPNNKQKEAKNIKDSNNLMHSNTQVGDENIQINDANAPIIINKNTPNRNDSIK